MKPKNIDNDRAESHILDNYFIPCINCNNLIHINDIGTFSVLLRKPFKYMCES